MIHLYPEIFARCVPGSIKDAVHLSAVSKEYQVALNSEAFFTEWLRCKDPHHPFLGRKVELFTLKDRYFASWLAFTHKMESFPMSDERSLANSERVDLLVNMQLVPLKERAEPVSLHIPEGIKVPPDTYLQKAARSDKYLAINIQPDMPILIYSSDGMYFRKMVEVKGLLHFELVDEKLFTVDCFCNLIIHFLESDKTHLKINLPGILPKMFYSPFTFYKNFIVYQPNKRSNGISYIFPFKEMKWEKIESSSPEAAPVPLGNELLKIIINYNATQAVEQNEKAFIISVHTSWCASENRMFFADRANDKIVISSFDSVTRQLSELHTMPSTDKSLDLHCTATKLYCLFRDEINSEGELDLLTMTFGKV